MTGQQSKTQHNRTKKTTDLNNFCCLLCAFNIFFFFLIYFVSCFFSIFFFHSFVFFSVLLLMCCVTDSFLFFMFRVNSYIFSSYNGQLDITNRHNFFGVVRCSIFLGSRFRTRMKFIYYNYFLLDLIIAVVVLLLYDCVQLAS